MRLLKKPSWKFSDSWGKTSSESKSWNKFDIFKRIPEDIQQKVVSNRILDGLAIKPPCRFQTFRINFDIGGNQINVDIVFDIAHNYDAMICLKMKTMERYSASKIPIR